MKSAAELRETKLIEVKWHKLLCTREAYKPCKFCEQPSLIPSCSLELVDSLFVLCGLVEEEKCLF